jgi:CRP-like cAMP-binding protein
VLSFRRRQRTKFSSSDVFAEERTERKLMGTADQSRNLGNFILDSLPQKDYELLRPHLRLVELNQGDVLFKIQESIIQVYFPTTALLSWIHSTSEGETVEIGIIGFEGMIGTSLLFNQTILPWQVDVQLTGKAFRLSAEVFLSVLNQSTLLQQKASHFAHLKLVQLSQYAVCNRFHAVEQRLCRWLLSAQDRAKSHELLLTRDILAATIGSTRPAVSIATGTLQSAGLIQAIRGKITIVNREEMEEATCECYHVIKQEFDRYLQS